MLDILKRIGVGILLPLFVLSAHEDSFAFSLDRAFSEVAHQSAISDETITDNGSGRTDSYDAVCGSQHSGRLPCGNDCQLTGCLGIAIVP